MLFEEQISARRERGEAAIQQILSRPGRGIYGDYQIRSTTGNAYRVAMRGPGLHDNFCSCRDFSANTLGTCKHIEGLLQQLRKMHGKAVDRDRYQRTRASVSLVYGDSIEVRL